MAELITVDAAVVGDGVAGCATAAELARHGLATTLVGRPRETSGDYDVLLTERMARLVAPTVPLRRAGAYTAHFGDDATAGWADAGLVICCKSDLERRAAESAEQAGARRMAADVVAVEGDTLHLALPEGGSVFVRARHVVLATGWTSSSRRASHGDAVICTRRFRGAFSTGTDIHLRTPSRHGTPVSIRVLPAPDDDHQVSVTVTALDDCSEIDAGKLMAQALEALIGADSRYRSLAATSPLVAGVAGTSFTPGASVTEGRLVVGDALGLLDPFAGQALDNGVRSALLAAESIVTHRDDPGAAAQRYRAGVAGTFAGYGEGVHELSRHFHLAWRVLAATAHSENPFFVKARTSVLVPGGFATLTPESAVLAGSRSARALHPFLAGCSELALAAVRDRWPFVASVVAAGRHEGRQNLRPALLFGAALCAEGAPPDIRRADVGAAVELTTLGMLGLTASPVTTTPVRGVDWASASAILAGDFLLAQAGTLIAGRDTDLDTAFADWLAELAEHRGDQLGEAPSNRDPSPFLAALFEFPARIGAQLAGASDATVALLRELGASLGRLFGHTEDLLALTGRPTRLDTTLQGLLDVRLSALPHLLSGEGDVTAEALAADPVLGTRAVHLTRVRARAEYSAATELARRIPAPTARAILLDFCRAMAEPALTSPRKPTGERTPA
ncbi:hypothetical protein [Amycolatopsis sp. NPDC051102]|uniref:hypothetical protein n=1 Tax=Amycolatopsis sp. NPDC051102 TaxID=3155163 RepID=UPI00341D29A6